MKINNLCYLGHRNPSSSTKTLFFLLADQHSWSTRTLKYFVHNGWHRTYATTVAIHFLWKCSCATECRHASFHTCMHVSASMYLYSIITPCPLHRFQWDQKGYAITAAHCCIGICSDTPFPSPPFYFLQDHSSESLIIVTSSVQISMHMKPKTFPSPHSI